MSSPTRLVGSALCALAMASCAERQGAPGSGRVAPCDRPPHASASFDD